jgi:hypothetical protein
MVMATMSWIVKKDQDQDRIAARGNDSVGRDDADVVLRKQVSG